MNEHRNDRITDVLNRAATAGSGTLLSNADAADDGSPTSDVVAAAEDASEIVESSDPEALLEAFGLETLPDGTEPDSIPEAIAKGDPDAVEDLRRLLHLANLADRGDELDGAVGELRERIDRGDGAATTDADADVDADTNADAASESDSRSPADESGSADGDEDEADTAGEESTDASTADALSEKLRSSMESSLGSFGDDVADLRARLEEASSAVETDESEAEATDADAADDETADSAAEPEEAEETEEADDGLLEHDFGTETDRGGVGEASSAARRSTVAPPPSKRADMKGLARFSTMPKKNRK
ncbi:hypothetical protein [Halopiger thermotolerans]